MRASTSETTAPCKRYCFGFKLSVVACLAVVAIYPLTRGVERITFLQTDGTMLNKKKLKREYFIHVLPKTLED